MPDSPSTDHLRVTVAEATHRIGKRLIHVPPEGTCWREGEGGEGRWLKPEDVDGAGRNESIARHWHYVEVTLDPGVESRYLLRSKLAHSPYRALMLGTLGKSARSQLAPFQDALRTSAPMPRNQRVFSHDTPRAWLTLDCDNLDIRKVVPDDDVRMLDSELPDILFSAFDAAGLDWLIADCVMQLSSSHGLVNRHLMRAHLDYALPTPLTLAQQALVADYINEKTIAAGLGRLVDASIHERARLMFTGPPYLFRRVWRDGRQPVEEPVAAPPLQRVRLVRRNSPFIELPQDLVESFGKRHRIAQVRKLVSRTAALTAIAPIEPGNVYLPIRRRVYATAQNTPRHRWERALAQLQDELTAAIMALPDAGDEAKTRSRLKYASEEGLQRSWQGALARRYAWASPVDAPPLPPAHDAAAVRQRLSAIAREFKQRERSVPAQHLMIKVPPGIGKTSSVIEALDVADLTLGRTMMFSPITRLSAEIAARARALFPDDAYIQTLIRQHLGRTRLCTNPDYNAMALEFERAGHSPLKPVCQRCPQFQTCAWPQQRADKGSGLIAAQHAHIITALSQLDAGSDGVPAMTIVDESLLSTLLPETNGTRSLSALHRMTRRTVVRCRRKAVLQQTADLRAYRARALDLLSQCSGKLATRQLSWFTGTIEIRPKDGEPFTRTRLADAVESELATARGYIGQAAAAAERMHVMTSGGFSGHIHRRSLQHAVAYLRLSNWFIDLYRAFQAALDMGREHVFGLRRLDNRVLLRLRQPLPRVMAATPGLWLDGTADVDLWRAFFGGLDVETSVTELRVNPGAYHLTQYADACFSKRMLLGQSRTGGGRRADANIQRLRRFILERALTCLARPRAHGHAKVLAVAQKPVADALRQFPWPPNVAIEHFNNLRGVDRYKDAACGIFVGRPRPNPLDAELATEALHHDNPGLRQIQTADKPTFGQRIIRMRDGRAVAIPCERHPDPYVQQYLEQVSDAEVVQAIHRLRLFDRTPETAAELHVFGQVDTGLAVDVLADWTDAERGEEEIGALPCASEYGFAVRKRAHERGREAGRGVGREREGEGEGEGEWERERGWGCRGGWRGAGGGANEKP